MRSAEVNFGLSFSRWSQLPFLNWPSIFETVICLLHFKTLPEILHRFFFSSRAKVLCCSSGGHSMAETSGSTGSNQSNKVC